MDLHLLMGIFHIISPHLENVAAFRAPLPTSSIRPAGSPSHQDGPNEACQGLLIGDELCAKDRQAVVDALEVMRAGARCRGYTSSCQTLARHLLLDTILQQNWCFHCPVGLIGGCLTPF